MKKVDTMYLETSFSLHDVPKQEKAGETRLFSLQSEWKYILEMDLNVPRKGAKINMD